MTFSQDIMQFRLFKKILSLCEKYDEENDGEYSYFNPSVSEEEMLSWEQDS